MRSAEAPETGALAVVNRIDDQAHTLWEERAALRAEMAVLGQQRRELTEKLPWWAAPGRSFIDSDGNLCGYITWFPAIRDFELPDNPAARLQIRFSEYDIQQRCRHVWPKTKGAAEEAEMLRALKERLVDQKAEELGVGLAHVRRIVRKKRERCWGIQTELRKLAEAGSLAALAASTLLAVESSFTEQSRGDASDAAPAKLKMAAPRCGGLLRKHVDVLLAQFKASKAGGRLLLPPAETDFEILSGDRDNTAPRRAA